MSAGPVSPLAIGAVPAESRPSGIRFLGASIAVVVAGFCVACGATLYDLRQTTWTRAVAAETNLLNALAQDIGRNVEVYDLSLQAVVDGLAEPGLSQLDPDLQDRLLYDRAASAKDLGAMLVLDRNGVVVRGSAREAIGADLHDREFFQAQKADPGRGLFISQPFTRRVTGDDRVVALSRALRSDDGTFAGIVVGTMRLSYFQRLFSQAEIGPRGSINLFRLDGTTLMRVPSVPAQIGANLAGSANFQRFLQAPSGTFTGRAAVDGIERIYSFKHIEGLPLILNVAYATDDVFAPWRTKTIVISLALAVLCGSAGILGLRLRHQLLLTARTEDRLARSEAQYRLLADHAQDVIVRLDRALTRTYVSPAIAPVLGYRPDEMTGRSMEEAVHPDDRAGVMGLIGAAQGAGSNMEATYRLRHKDGHYVWVEARYSPVHEDGGFIVVLRDVTDRKIAEAQLETLNAELDLLARSDALTGLPNRRRFDETLDREWSRAKRDGRPLSLLVLDVDRFKAYNDRYGHQQGDVCLRALAEAVRLAVRRPGDLVARYGGEEFAVVLPETGEADAARVAERIRRDIEGLTLPHEGNASCGSVVTASIGCTTLVPTGDQRHALLLADADARLYEAKRTGRNRVVTALPTAPTAPVPADEAARMETLSAYLAVGAGAASASLDRLARLASELFEVPKAFVSLVDRDVVTVVGQHEVGHVSVPREHAFCSHTITGDDPFVIADTLADPRFAENPLVRVGIAFYAGAPVVSPVDGRKLGALCIVDDHARSPLDADKRRLLTALAGLAAHELERWRLAAPGPEAAALAA